MQEFKSEFEVLGPLAQMVEIMMIANEIVRLIIDLLALIWTQRFMSFEIR